ncbi:MAG: hypothetical protein AAGF28_13565 [Pseudomonadota bacterium]
MQNPMQVAEKRIKEYRMAISKKENEIVELKERLEDLDNFLEFGQALVGKPGEGAAQTAPEQPKTEADTKKQATPSAEDKADDDWGSDDEASPINNGITRVLSQRIG